MHHPRHTLHDNLLVAAQWAADTFARKRARLAHDSESVLDRAVRFAANNPWVYVLAILAIFLFVGLLIFLCAGSSKDPEADRKKTDAFAEDDQPSEGEGEAEAEGGDVEGEGGEEEAEQKPPTSGKAQLSEPQAEAADSAPLLDNEGGGDHQRKRKPRKE
ncbi:hypothetical protein O0L34_g8575 [Tuta absoluta]|nr:hypothetical protein O0L34_g8575 [Tuta absoluta]